MAGLRVNADGGGRRPRPNRPTIRHLLDQPAPTMHRIATLAIALLAGFATLPAAAQQAAAANKPAASKRAPVPATPREQLQSEAMGLALAIQTTEAINDAQLEVASQVLTGHAECELNQSVDVEAVPEKPGVFVVRFKERAYVMTPELTTTGAVRLADSRSGVVWLQIPLKSMLLNAQAGRRMTDMCQHAQQRAAVDAVRAAAGQATAKP